ncbi:hypothetical protein PsYK624_166370 [Phanerochaete sordida]|uniref:Uncharacterized protein n=1 Tax=Phanerochaete sordida TaxID=48140 RepID=A0A9P3GSY7_9APHY|nr:hypothetical protein PsYK624_166370 [Phanerochaete sordida]
MAGPTSSQQCSLDLQICSRTHAITAARLSCSLTNDALSVHVRKTSKVSLTPTGHLPCPCVSTATHDKRPHGSTVRTK